MASSAGNQIFVSLRQGKTYPPLVCDVRVKYEQTIGQLKVAVEKKTGVPVDKQQLFWQGRELTSKYDSKSLLELNLHTGFSLQGYDLRETADYWPPVVETPEGLAVVAKFDD